MASTSRHAKLDESEALDVGNKEELANGYPNLKQLNPNLNTCINTSSVSNYYY